MVKWHEHLQTVAAILAYVEMVTERMITQKIFQSQWTTSIEPQLLIFFQKEHISLCIELKSQNMYDWMYIGLKLIIEMEWFQRIKTHNERFKWLVDGCHN